MEMASSVNRRWLYVGNRGSREVTVIDLTPGRLAGRIAPLLWALRWLSKKLPLWILVVHVSGHLFPISFFIIKIMASDGIFHVFEAYISEFCGMKLANI